MSENKLKEAIEDMIENAHEDCSLSDREPLISLPSLTSPTPTISSRHRRRRLHLIAMISTILFIFFSISLLILYFALPLIIKRKVEAFSINDMDEERVKADNIKLANVTDRAFDIYANVSMQRPGMFVGAKVSVRGGWLEWSGAKVAHFTLINPVYIPARVKSITGNLSVHVTITDTDRFGGLINALIVEDRVNVTVAGDLMVKPDYLPVLPGVYVSVPFTVDGAPTLSRRFSLGKSVNPVVDIISGRLNELLISGECELPVFVNLPEGIPLSFIVNDMHENQLAQVTGSVKNEKIVSTSHIPPFNEQLRQFVKAKTKQIVISGDPEKSHVIFKGILPKISPQRFSFPIPPISLIKRIILIDLFGKTETITSNPFSSPIYIHQLEHVDIYYRKRLLGDIKDQPIEKEIPAKSKNFALENKNSKMINFKGGYKSILQIIAEIGRRGYVDVAIIGSVSVSIGDYKVDGFPVAEEKLRIIRK